MSMSTEDCLVQSRAVERREVLSFSCQCQLSMWGPKLVITQLRLTPSRSLGVHRLSMSIVGCRLLASFLPLLASVSEFRARVVKGSEVYD